MKAKIYKADRPNVNGIVYPKDVLEKAVEEYNNQTSRVVTLEDYPGDQLPTIELENVVGEATLSMDNDGYVIADITLLDNDKANQVKDEIVKGCSPSLLPSSFGIPNENHIVDGEFAVCKLVIPTEPVKTGDEHPEMFQVEDDETSDEE